MKRALIVEDQDQGRYLLRTVLTADGYEVVEAANGGEALDRARHARPDIIISDILMPQMDGFALCRECKRDPQLKTVPFVFYTATYTSAKDEALALSLGAARFIVKPVDHDEFTTLIRAVLRDHEAEGAVAPDLPLTEETAYYRLYNESLVRKLEDKMLELKEEVAQRARAEEELRKLSVAVEQSPALVCLTDTAGTIEYVNRRFSAVTGYEIADLRGRSSRVLKSGHTSAAEYARLWNVITAGGEWRGEFRNRKKNGDLYWELATISPIRDAAGAITHFVKVAEDVTERRRAEVERARLQAQLHQSQKMEAVGRLAGGVAHDFNNLLTVVIGYGELALQGTHDQDQIRRDVGAMMEAARRAAGITRQLLTFARQEAASPAVVNPNEALTALRRMLQRLVGEDVALEVVLAPDVWPVRIDPSHFDQILVNIVANARDAIANTGTVVIETTNAARGEHHCRRDTGTPPGDYVVLRVSDTGAGMDEETRERMFEPFFTTKPRNGGTGLGLSTVLGVVEQGGGHVDVESAVGRGTTLTVCLPRCHEAPVREPRPAEQPDADGGETILVVEDERAVLELVRRTLESYKYRVLAAASPGEVFALSDNHEGRIHLLLTDVVMPHMNGKEIAERIASRRPDIRVLFMSGYSTDVVAQRDLLASEFECIQKPFSPRELASKVRQVLDD